MYMRRYASCSVEIPQMVMISGVTTPFQLPVGAVVNYVCVDPYKVKHFQPTPDLDILVRTYKPNSPA
jgi:hypothetical protein